jgi:hypothetical protein
MFNSTDIDSIFTSWTWSASSAGYPSTSFNLQYGPLGFELYAGGTILNVDNNFTDTIVNTNLMSAGVYNVYVQAVCASDTSQFVGPFTVTMPLTNDSICLAETLPVDGVSYAFNNTGATVDAQDVDIAPPATGANTTTGWVNNFMNNTTWFKFIAPPSGDIRINATSVNFNGQIAVYDPNSCNGIIANDLVAANDDEIGGTSLAPNFTICNLVPNQVYYLMHDGFAAPGVHTIAISELVLNAGINNGILNVCYGDTANLFNGISNYQQGGTWTQQIPTLGLQIYSPSRAGDDGLISVCLNEPFNLLSGLAGNVDFGGSWINPLNVTLPSSLDTAGTIGGQFDYLYVYSNGVCPNDTAVVTVAVNSGCDYNVGLIELENYINLYPNPTHDLLNIEISNEVNVTSILIEDLNGKIIHRFTNASGEINLSDLMNGIYIVRIHTDLGEYLSRIIKN